VGAEAAVQVAAEPQLPPVVAQRLRMRQLVAPEQPQGHRHVALVQHRRADPRQLAERRRRRAAVDAVVAAAVVVAISPACQTLTAPSTLRSSRSLATRTACRRCSSGRRI